MGAVRTMLATLLVALIATSAVCAAGPPVRVTVSVEPDTATIGDQLHYTLVVDRAESVSVRPPDFATALAPFEVLDGVLLEPEAADGRVVETRELVITVFDVGEQAIPQLEFGYVTAHGDSGVALSDSLVVTIASVLPEVREDQQVGPLDIKPPMDLPRNWWPLVVALLVLAALSVAGFFLRRWLMSRGADEADEPAEEEPPVPRIAAHVVALERLDELARDDPIGRGEIPAFYVRVTEIVRLYLRDRFGVDAIEMTTSELPVAMREARIEEREIDWSASYLSHADLAKFAKHEPVAERARADLDEAREFVERTRLRGEEAGDGEDTDAGEGTGLTKSSGGAEVEDVARDEGLDRDGEVSQ